MTELGRRLYGCRESDSAVRTRCISNLMAKAPSTHAIVRRAVQTVSTRSPAGPRLIEVAERTELCSSSSGERLVGLLLPLLSIGVSSGGEVAQPVGVQR